MTNRMLRCLLLMLPASVCCGADYFSTSFQTGVLSEHLRENQQPGIYVIQDGKLINSRPGLFDYVSTKACDYGQDGFVFELTVAVQATADEGGAAVVGIGSAAADNRDSVYLTLQPLAHGLAALSSSKYGWHWDSGRNSLQPGTYRVRLINSDGELTFQLDRDYGGHFDPEDDYSLPLGIFDLNETNSRLFFGSASSGVAFSDLVLTQRLPAPDPPEFKLIPRPRQVKLNSAEFLLTNDVPIFLAQGCTVADRFAAVQLQKEIEAEFGLKLKISRQTSSRGIVLGRLDLDEQLRAMLQQRNVGLPNTLPEEGYVISITDDDVVVGGADAAGLYYGVQTVRQLMRANCLTARLPGCTIVDWPGLRLRGWQHDISRGPIPTMDFLKRQVRTLAHYKLNFFTLYTEHVFRLEKHPTIAPAEGLTAAQVRKLDQYCQQHHVQLVGNFQSFGHTTNIQWTPGYAHLFRNGPHYPRNFDPTKEQVYDFLSDAYGEIAPAYQSPLFVINCDEVGGMDAGAYARHITRVAELLKPFGKTPMMWGDIALHKKDIIAMLPRDMVLLTWNYHAQDSFESSILPIAQAQRPFLVCPAVWSFGSLLPRFQHSIKNISNFVRDGAQHGAQGMLCTQWQDAGEELSNANWYLLVWSAENAWLPLHPRGPDANARRRDRLAHFNQAFDPLFYGLAGTDICASYLRLSRLRNYPFLAPIAQHSDRYCYRGFWCVSLRPGVSRPGPLDLIAGDPEHLQQQTQQFIGDLVVSTS